MRLNKTCVKTKRHVCLWCSIYCLHQLEKSLLFYISTDRKSIPSQKTLKCSPLLCVWSWGALNKNSSLSIHCKIPNFLQINQCFLCHYLINSRVQKDKQSSLWRTKEPKRVNACELQRRLLLLWFTLASEPVSLVINYFTLIDISCKLVD